MNAVKWRRLLQTKGMVKWCGKAPRVFKRKWRAVAAAVPKVQSHMRTIMMGGCVTR